ncbi:MAG: carbohydrate kinase family protein [Firmicutes bacterium]|nr:carbohydrate kinase family protein [Bacillota bacterium]
MKIAIVGGINIDIEGVPFKTIKYHDSNPGRIRLSYGGVGRNIAENLARLGGDCAMISCVGDEPMSLGAVSHLKDLGVDVSHVRVFKEERPSMYLSILDEKGDMEIGLSDMEIIDRITPEYIDEIRGFLESAEVVALDGNLTEELLEHATGLLRGTKLFYDPVSANKAVRAKKFAGRFFAVKPNRIEAEAILDMKIDSDGDVREAGRRFMELGVSQVFITLGEDGVFYMEAGDSGFIRPVGGLEIASATGAGDSFSACILLGISRGMSAKQIAAMGMAASRITMMSGKAVSEEISMELIEELLSKEI